MNTLFSYLYRDACNYKKFNEITISGKFTLDDLLTYLHDGEFFIPSEVGLADLQDEPLTVDDHIWHEIESISESDNKPSVPFTAGQFIESFRLAKANDWNQNSVFKRKGML